MKTQYSYFIVMMFIAAACDHSSSSKNNIQPDREGSAITITNPLLFDGSASMNYDGSRIVFITGRDSTAAESQFKAYYAYVSLTSNPSENIPLYPVTNHSIGQEINVAISPDGDQLLVTTYDKDSLSHYLYLIPYGDADAEPQLLSEIKGFYSQVSFSPDSSLFAFGFNNLEDNSNNIFIGQVSDGSLTQINVDETSEYAPVWIGPSGSPYQLITKTRDDSYFSRSFTSFSGLAAAPGTEILSTKSTYNDIPIAFTQTGMAFVDLNINSQDGSMPRFTDDVPSPDTFFDSTSSIKILDYSGNETATWTNSGTRITGLKVNEQYSYAFSTGVVPYKCGDNEGAGQMFVITDLADTSVSPTYVTPYIETVDGNWLATNTPCAVYDSKHAYEHTMTDFSISTSATNHFYRILYTSFRSGDPEIRLLHYENGIGFKVFDISENKAS